MFHNRQLLNEGEGRWQILFVVFSLSIAMLACGGSGSVVGEQGLDQVNSSISGLPQFVAPSSTFVPTLTLRATDVQPKVWIDPAGWHPAQTLCINGYTNSYGNFVCTSWAITPGYYSNPGHYVAGSTSTPPSTFTPYPTPTPCVSSFTYYFGDEVFTDASNETLTLGLSLGNVRIFSASNTAQQIVAWSVEVRNLGQINYVLLAPFQIYVAGIDGEITRYGINEGAARELGLELDEAARDGYSISPSESVTFDMFAYTHIGTVTSLAYILDPYANGFDGEIAGGNVAYWETGDRGACGGRISGHYTPSPNLTPQPTATLTPTSSYCVTDPSACIYVIQ
jgi:hypothetical protein